MQPFDSWDDHTRNFIGLKHVTLTDGQQPTLILFALGKIIHLRVANIHLPKIL